MWQKVYKKEFSKWISKTCAKYHCFHLLLDDMEMSLDGFWSSLDMFWPTLDKFWSRVTFPLDHFWSRLDTFWTRLEICFHKSYKKCGLTFEYEKKNFTAFLQIIYLNFWANNTYEIQQFFINPWTRYGPHWSCFGPVVQKKSMWTSNEIALTDVCKKLELKILNFGRMADIFVMTSFFRFFFKNSIFRSILKIFRIFFWFWLVGHSFHCMYKRLGI